MLSFGIKFNVNFLNIHGICYHHIIFGISKHEIIYINKSWFEWKKWISQHDINEISLHERRNFCLTKISEKDKKNHIFVSFHMLPFQENIKFSELFFKQKCKKVASSCKCVFLYSCINMKFSYTIAGRKDEIFYDAL